MLDSRGTSTSTNGKGRTMMTTTLTNLIKTKKNHTKPDSLSLSFFYFSHASNFLASRCTRDDHRSTERRSERDASRPERV